MISCHEFAVRSMREDDIARVVEIHLRSFPGFFLTFLGSGFLSLLYKGILHDPGGIVVIGSDGQRVQGFVAGVTNQQGFYGRLIREQKWAFAWTALAAAVKRPRVIPRLFRALNRPTESQKHSARACLMSVAVDPDSQGTGLGQALVRAFLQELKNRRVRAVCLTTDQEHNERVNSFYRGLGFEVVRSFSTPEGRIMNEYRLVLSAQ